MTLEIERIGRLLGAFAALAVQRGGRLTKIRLVKFLYLLDLYSAQNSNQAGKRTFTNWSWAFIHYGPYCRESTDAIDLAAKNGFLVAYSYESSFSDEDYRLYGPGEKLGAGDADKVMDSLPIHVSSRLRSALKRWYDDTYGLLDYVYFRTGPMEHARPNDVLSFASERMPDMEAFRPVEMVPLSKKKKAALREAIQKLRKEGLPRGQPPELFDDEYFRFVSTTAGSETEVGLTGIANLSFDASSDD